MKHLPINQEPAGLENDDAWQLADWKESPANVLESVDHLLAPHGLEVIVYAPGDTYHFAIQPRAVE